MSGISTAIEITDRMTGPLNRITAALYSTTTAFQGVDQASSVAFDSTAVQAITQELYGYENKLQDIQNELNKANNRIDDMQQEIDGAKAKAASLESAFSQVGSVIAGLGLGMLIKDQVSQAIDYASDLTEVQNVVDVVFGDDSAVNEWSKNMLNAVGLNELSAKQYSGTLGAMLSSSGLTGDAVESMSMRMTELAGDMASFYNLDSEEAFNKIRSGLSGETEPLKQLGIDLSVASLEAYAMSEGVNKAYDEMSQAEKVALRYSYLLDATANAQGDYARTSDSYANQIKSLQENWKGFTGELATNALPVLAYGIGLLNDGVTFISDNWSVIQPILTGLLAIIGGYIAALGIYHAVKAGVAIVEGVHAAAVMLQTGATFTATAAQYGFNAALLACPLTWIILIIIGVIAAIYALVAAFNKATDSSVSATGIIAGVFATLGAHIINNVVIPVQNMFASLVNFIGNAFNDPISAVKVLFYDMALTVLGYISNMASAIETLINKIPGVEVDITSGIDGFYKELEAAQQSVKDESGWVEYMTKMDYIDYEDAFDAGYGFGEGVDKKLDGFFNPEDLTKDLTDSLYPEEDPNTLLAGIAGDTSSIADGVDISKENLKYMRDVAEREAVNRFTTAEIKVDMTNNNSISNNMDIDGIVDQLTVGVQEAMESAAEGVHE